MAVVVALRHRSAVLVATAAIVKPIPEIAVIIVLLARRRWRTICLFVARIDGARAAGFVVASRRRIDVTAAEDADIDGRLAQLWDTDVWHVDFPVQARPCS